jgi:hypothetical protein
MLSRRLEGRKETLLLKKHLIKSNLSHSFTNEMVSQEARNRAEATPCIEQLVALKRFSQRKTAACSLNTNQARVATLNDVWKYCAKVQAQNRPQPMLVGKCLGVGCKRQASPKGLAGSGTWTKLLKDGLHCNLRWPAAPMSGCGVLLVDAMLNPFLASRVAAARIVCAPVKCLEASKWRCLIIAARV